MKKILTFLMLIFAFSVHAEIIASGDDCGAHCHWEIENGVLTIKGSGPMYDYSYNSGSTNAPWFGLNNQITNIVVENGITHIGLNAFLYADAKAVSLPHTLTSIAASAFHNTKLTNVIVPSSVESVGYNAFACTPLQNLTIDDQTLFEKYDSQTGFLTGVDLNSLHIYCKGVSSKCDQNLRNGGYHLSTKQAQRRRIYTIEEATKVSKPTGNTFKLRYK
ncbi:MAG: leucine-rich repeat protein [Alphaproteobacteria bacterium]|nr:leucine-rich repeat protein [Alphaproteobacteria bacterium]